MVVREAWRPEVGRYLEVSRAVRAGELLFQEEPLFLSSRVESVALVEELFDDLQEEAWSLPLATQVFLCVLKELLDSGGQGSEAGSVAAGCACEASACEACPKLEKLAYLKGHVGKWHSSAMMLYQGLKAQVAERVSSERFEELYATCATNAHEADGGDGAALFLKGSMAEHSCRPTAFKQIRAGSGSVPQGETRLVVHALRDLDVGEAISISYIPEYYPTWLRQSMLQHGFNFQCGCERCLSGGAELCCCFVCPECEGPCCPPGAVYEEGAYELLRCEDCGLELHDTELLGALKRAERCEEFATTMSGKLHPYHFKIFHMYLKHLDQVPAGTALQILPQLQEAFHRLRPVEKGHPLHAQLAQCAAECWEKVEDEEQEAGLAWLRAAELYDLCAGPASADAAQCCRAAQRATASGQNDATWRGHTGSGMDEVGRRDAESARR
ncbi:unnamed protein product [Durusdinium trenchii]|uniref:SET domain-containing protein n=1 Tax=Durusdinium trenchii TaxID=1381693 RepID=A0ABP0NY06_9DINO